jgi:hypothetical protein
MPLQLDDNDDESEVLLIVTAKRFPRPKKTGDPQAKPMFEDQSTPSYPATAPTFSKAGNTNKRAGAVRMTAYIMPDQCERYEDMRTELRKEFKLKLSKTDMVEMALIALRADFNEERGNSSIVRQLKAKKKRG